MGPTRSSAIVSLLCIVTAEERRHTADRERMIQVVGGCSRTVEFVIRGANVNCAAVACEADSPPLSVALFHIT